MKAILFSEEPQNLEQNYIQQFLKKRSKSDYIIAMIGVTVIMLLSWILSGGNYINFEKNYSFVIGVMFSLYVGCLFSYKITEIDLLNNHKKLCKKSLILSNKMNNTFAVVGNLENTNVDVYLASVNDIGNFLINFSEYFDSNRKQTKVILTKDLTKNKITLFDFIPVGDDQL